MTLSPGEIKKRSNMLRTIKVTIVPINLIYETSDVGLSPSAISLRELFHPDTTEPRSHGIIADLITALVLQNIEQDNGHDIKADVLDKIQSYLEDGGVLTPYVLTAPNRWYALNNSSTSNAVLEQFLLYKNGDTIDPTVFVDFRPILRDHHPDHKFDDLLPAMSRYHWIDPAKYAPMYIQTPVPPIAATTPSAPDPADGTKQSNMPIFAKGPPVPQPNTPAPTQSAHPLFPKVNLAAPTSSNIPVRPRNPPQTNSGSTSPTLSTTVQDRNKLDPPAHLTRDEYATYIEDISQRPVPSATKSISVAAIKYADGTSILSWYHRIRNYFGIQFGTYLPPVPTLSKDSVMGNEWDNGCLPPALYAKLGSMNALLLQHLRHPDTFPDQTYRDIVEIAGDNMYVALRNLLRPCVPGLSDDHALEEPITEQERTTSWFTLTQRVITYCEQANAHGRTFTRYQRLVLTLNHLNPSWRAELRRSCLSDIVTPRYDRVDNIPIDLYLSSLPTTLARKAKALEIRTTFRTDTTGTATQSVPTAIHQVQEQNKPNCLLCDSSEHLLRACPALKRMLDHAKAPRKASLLRHCLKPIVDSKRMPRNAVRAIEADMTNICDSPVDLLTPIPDTEAPTETTPTDDTNDSSTHDDKDDAVQAVYTNAPLFTQIDNYNQGSDSDDNVIASVIHPGIVIHDSYQDEIFQNLFPATDENQHIRVIQQITCDKNQDSGHTTQHSTVACHKLGDPHIHNIKNTGPSMFELDHSQQCLVPTPIHICRIETYGMKAQVDSGADVGVCSHKQLLHDFTPFPPGHPRRTHLQDAGKNKHSVEGAGFVLVPCNQGYIRYPAAFVPTIPGILINPRQHGLAHVTEESLTCNNDKNTHIYTITRATNTDPTIRIELTVGDKVSRLFTRSLLPAFDTEHTDDVPSIRQVGNDEFQRTLWHNRLAHLNYKTLSTLHKHVEGLPNLKEGIQHADTCPTCAESKLRRSPRGDSDTARDATMFGQGIALDWMFIVQQSKDEERRKRLAAHNGDTSILVLIDMFSGVLKGATSSSKSPPLAWLNRHLSKIRPPRDVRCFVLMDEGGELGRNHELRKLCEAHRYEIRTSAPDMHNQSGMVERPIQTISNGIRTMLHSANVATTYWNYAYYYYEEIYNRIPHGIRTKTPFELATHRKPDLSRFRTWGCRVYIRPPGERSSRLDNHCNIGTFLGFTSTDKQIRYLDHRTRRIKTAAHVRFDEGMNGDTQLPPNAVMLRQALGRAAPAEEAESYAPDDINIFAQSEYFPQHITVEFCMRQSDIDKNYDTLGFLIAEDIILQRGYLFDVAPHSSASKIRGIRTKLLGSYLIEVDGTTVATKKEIDAALSATVVDRHNNLTKPIKLVFAPDKNLLRNNLEHPSVLPRLHSDQLRRIALIQESREDSPVATLDAQWQYDDDTYSTQELDLYIRGVTTVALSQSKFTRTQIMNGPERQAWLEAEWKQLDTMKKDGMYGKSIPRSQCEPGADILGVVWTYLIKWNGIKKARNCCDGRPLSKRQNKAMLGTYAACIGQTGLRIFVALAAQMGYSIWDLDAVNAYAQSPPPENPTYVRVDKQYQGWMKARCNIDVPSDHVLPVLHAIQGHPAAGGLWQAKVTEDLRSIGFTNTRHEPCIYRIVYKGALIFLCRQVDDMLVASDDWSKARSLMQLIGTKVNIEFGEEPSVHYNGIDLQQNGHSITITCETYINKLLKQHGWDTPSKGEETPVEPIHPDSVTELETTNGPDIDSVEGKALSKTMGYGYRAIVGELTYAYVVARLDIGYAVVLLSKKTQHPARCHYIAAKRVMRYLRQTKDKGLMYWRIKPIATLPPSQHVPRALEDIELAYPYTADPYLCSLYVDAAHATCLSTRRSIAGRIITLGGTAISYQSKMQSVVATSSTEAEFMAAVQGGKSLLSIRSILRELGIDQNGASPIFEDNAAAIMMANQSRPTDRTRHIDIQYFALQEWIKKGDLKMHHIAGTINSADANTKALAKKLFTRHVTRSMGHLGSPYTSGKYKVPATFVDQNTADANTKSKVQAGLSTGITTTPLPNSWGTPRNIPQDATSRTDTRPVLSESDRSRKTERDASRNASRTPHRLVS